MLHDEIEKVIHEIQLHEYKLEEAGVVLTRTGHGITWNFIESTDGAPTDG